MGSADNKSTPCFRLSRATPSSKTHDQEVKRRRPNRLRIDSDGEEDDGEEDDGEEDDGEEDDSEKDNGEEDHDEETIIPRVLFIFSFPSLSVAVETDA